MFDAVPDEWHVAALAELATIKTGKTPSTKEPRYWDGGVPFVTPSDITDATYPEQVERFLTDTGAAASTIAPAGTVLFTCIASIGKACILAVPSSFNQQINACIPNPDVDSYFLFHALKARTEHFKDMAGTTAVPIINKSTFANTRMMVPPLDEQRRIAAVLRSADETITANQAIFAQVEALWQAMTEKLVWGLEKQNSDCVRPLGTALRGSDYGVNVPLTLETVGHPVLRMGNIQDGHIDLSDLKWGEVPVIEAEALALSVGDILFNRTNSRDLVGKVALVREPTDCLYASYIVRLSVDRTIADPYYLFAVLHSDRTQNALKAIATPGVSQSNINPTNLKMQHVPLPDLATQRAIAGQLRAIEDARLVSQQQLGALQVIRKDLTANLFSGRVRVPA
jgi:type I restriction enzyme S subunit